MNSPVVDQQTLRFGRLLHYAGLAVVLVVGALAYNWFYTPLEAAILDSQMQLDDLEIMGRNAPAIRREHTRLTQHLKDIEERYAALETALREQHPYEVPEIIALPVAAGWGPYLRWVDNETRPPLLA